MKDIEIEIQVKVEKIKPLLEFLKKQGQFKSKLHQIDNYFIPAHRNFLNVRPVKEWLRLRATKGSCSINYKNWYFDKNGRSYHCDEFETKFGNLAQMKKIFKVLNFKPIVRVDKLRETWTYKTYEIAIDTVSGLGNFVEIEYIGKDKKKNPKKITEEMVYFLKKLGCGKLKRNYLGYPFLLLFPKESKYEEL
jgi:adenylate cyclase class 2